MFHRVPLEIHEHVGHRVLFGIGEISEGFEDVNPVVVSLRVFLIEKPENLPEAVALGGYIEIDEIAPGAAACNRAHFHAGDVARISDRNVVEPVGCEWHWVGVAQEADLGCLDGGVERVRRFCDEREAVEDLDTLEKRVFVEVLRRKEVQVQGEPVAELQSQPCSTRKIEVVQQMRVPEGE